MKKVASNLVLLFDQAGETLAVAKLDGDANFSRVLEAREQLDNVRVV